MRAKLITRGMWQIPVAVKDCLCPDGVRRRARITGEADSFYSIPASVPAPVSYVDMDGEIRRKTVTVSGFVTGREGDDGGKDYEFIPYAPGKNAWAFDPTVCFYCRRPLASPPDDDHPGCFVCASASPPPSYDPALDVRCPVCQRPAGECERAEDGCPGCVPF